MKRLNLVIEIEGNARQATATVSVSNEITAAGVSDGGAGYETAPTVTSSGSGSVLQQKLF